MPRHRRSRGRAGAARGEVGAEQIAQRGALEPLAVQPPFAAGIEQAVNDEGRQDELPMGALAVGRQPPGPEAVENPALARVCPQ